ncbi:homoserine O-acetyltransferase/O-succinyltransferase family protein [Liquorilactobacillus capillatus]|uniref:Homoserine O-acetyltransferase n=1 Tax=Liquorilactobacillus capillatus DSM 19910 TaxID=1423731 RepID=A0A0R1M6Q8_9LACO|nr:homoserine O-succinyltransferase [Liquorilactobacillus capillatus]KRL03577.1 Homoserine O-succinyltransferase [Liquorilactobacillus capillatus DSM 19910]
MKQKLLILNLMPNKLETEKQLNYVFKNNNENLEKTYIYLGTHHFKSIQPQSVKERYRSFKEIKFDYYDGLIVTGAPIEHIPFTEVDYWVEFKQLIEWTKKHCKKALLLCWAAQAGMYCIAKVPKRVCKEKLFGIYELTTYTTQHVLLQGMDDNICMPFSRYSTNEAKDLKPEKFNIIANSSIAGPTIIETKDRQFTFITGHPEYETQTLDQEYQRDLSKKRKIKQPVNYYTGCGNKVINTWSGYSQQLFQNWLGTL